MATAQDDRSDIEVLLGHSPEPDELDQRHQNRVPGSPTSQRLCPREEWTAATLAHGSVVLTLALSLAGGVGVLVGPTIPLAMYFGYRDRSRFVAYHAMQSFVYQTAFALAYIVLVAASVVWLTMAWAASGLLAALLMVFLLIPFAALLTLLVVLGLATMPVAGLGYALYAAYHVYQGADFRYWLVGDWVEREMRL